MRSKLQNIASRFLAILMVVGLCAANSSCTDPETTDSTKFAIFYLGITDIGPSMNFNMDGPTYIGGAPSDFAITRVTLDGETYDTNCFEINAATGAIKSSNTNDLPVGTYCLSISCLSNGKYHEFKDAVTINMLAPVPDGITVEPSEVTVDFEELFTEKASAQVTTEEGTHVHISKYEIIQEEGKEYFAISTTGKITANSSYKGEILPGKYILNLKLKTEAGTGIYENALVFNITSKPLAILYTPNSVKVEVDQAFTSNIPTFKGSTEELVYSIKSISPETSHVSINASTGEISLNANNGLEIGNTFKVAVTATNRYGTKDIEEAFTINIVAFINNITKLTYVDQTKTQAVAFEFGPSEFEGDEPNYSFVNLDPKLVDKLTINQQTGVISAKKGNTIETDTYAVSVQAKNSKSEIISNFNLTIAVNPNFFTYIRYGNNLNLTPTEEFADQFEYETKAIFQSSKIAASTDIPDNRPVKWTIEAKNSNTVSGAVISDKGEISFTNAKWNNNYGCSVMFVTATVGDGDEAVSKTVPVFIRHNNKINNIFIDYRPFAVKMNPSKGGTTSAPTIKLNGAIITDYTLFLMDYRRDFYYYSFIENHQDGITTVNGSFMRYLWEAFYKSIEDPSINYSARKPMSYYDNSNKTQTLGYVNGGVTGDLSITINPGKWKDAEGVYANGVFIGRVSFVIDGDLKKLSEDSTTKNQFFPLAIWFDERF